MEDSIDGSWDFVISKKLSCALVIPFATNLYVREVGAFTFCVGLAWLARCVLPIERRRPFVLLLAHPSVRFPPRERRTRFQFLPALVVAMLGHAAICCHGYDGPEIN